jgi:hypothetical protein
MASASQVLADPIIRLPHLTMPKLRRPRLSSRTRAVLMMGLMISPAFLSDYIGYGVERMFYTSGQIAQMRPPDSTTLAHVEMFRVACGDPTMPPAEQGGWAGFAARNGWLMDPQAGATCFRPDRVLLGVVGLKTFNVACPTLVLSVADRKRWMDFAGEHGWGPYPQAGADCVDP